MNSMSVFFQDVYPNVQDLALGFTHHRDPGCLNLIRKLFKVDILPENKQRSEFDSFCAVTIERWHLFLHKNKTTLWNSTKLFGLPTRNC